LASIIGGPHYAGILIQLIGLHFGGTVPFMNGRDACLSPEERLGTAWEL